MEALAGFAAEHVRPSPIGPGLRFPGAGEALSAAGGPPCGDPSTPLVVCVNDPDRATRTGHALAHLAMAVGPRPMRIVVATGTHAFSPESCAEHESRIRVAVRRACDVVWHDSRPEGHVSVGPARLHEVVVGARDVVAIGSVEPHWFAGLTGAHKTATIGVMDARDIAANHALAMEPGARPFELDGNPVHEATAAALAALEDGRSVLALQHVDERWFAGEPLACLAAAASAARRRWLHEVPEPLDLLVACVNAPLSRSLYQAEKGIKNSEFAVRDGGTIVLDAPCEDGVGPDRFMRLLAAAPDGRSAREHVAREGYVLGDHKAVRWRALQDRGVALHLVAPRFPPDVAAIARIHVHATREAAVASVRATIGASARVAVVEDAGNLVVRVA